MTDQDDNTPREIFATNSERISMRWQA